jgi:hypothetical protein
MQPTPFRGHKIGAILTAGICYNGITIYQAARLMGNPLGRAVPSLFGRLSRWQSARGMPFSRRRASTHAHPNGSPPHHARIACGSY